MKVTFKTLGCKVNQYETQLMREQFLSAGFEEVLSDHPADFCVINTCTVTQKADSESRRLIRNARRQNPNSKIIVTGCYAELDEGEIKKLDSDLLIIKNSKKNKILQYLIDGVRHPNTDWCLSPQYDLVSGTKQIGVPDTIITRFEDRTKAFVKVQDGCDNFCSYCKVPLVRGRSRSRDIKEIKTEVTQLVLNGYKEIILTGICLGDWGRDSGTKLSCLLSEIEGIEGDFRVRLSSIEPWYVTLELIEKIVCSKRFCRHLHIPMQSADNTVLKRMNRHFMSKDFIRLINKIRSLIPEAAFTTDILVGFPGESEEQFDNTLKAVELTKPSRVHIFPFSIRKGTTATSFKDMVDCNIVKERAKKLKKLTNRLAEEYKKQFIGRRVEVLVETERDEATGLLTGYTDTYIKVVFEGPDSLKGKIYPLTLTPHLFNIQIPTFAY